MMLMLYNVITNSIGLFFSFLGVATFFYISRNLPSLVNRTTLRLQAALCLTDFLTHVRLFISGSFSPGVCGFLGFSSSYITTLYLTITVCIVLCFHLNLLSSKKVEAKIEKYFWYAILVVPVLHTVPPYVLGRFGSDQFGFCFIKADISHHEFMRYYLMVVPRFLVFLYCLIIVFFIIKRSEGVNDVLSKILGDRKVADDNRSLLQKIFSSWMSRFILYPLAFILINSGLVVDVILRSLGVMSNAVFYWAIAGLNFSGPIHYIALMCDPYFQDALIDIFFFKCNKFAKSRRRELKDEIVLMEANVRRERTDRRELALDDLRAWDEDEARALLQECTQNF